MKTFLFFLNSVCIRHSYFYDPKTLYWESLGQPRKHRHVYFFRYSLHINWNMTLFILNLALADLLYCLTSIPFYVVHYLYKGWPLGNSACYMFGAFR